MSKTPLSDTNVALFPAPSASGSVRPISPRSCLPMRDRQSPCLRPLPESRERPAAQTAAPQPREDNRPSPHPPFHISSGRSRRRSYPAASLKTRSPCRSAAARRSEDRGFLSRSFGAQLSPYPRDSQTPHSKRNRGQTNGSSVSD